MQYKLCSNAILHRRGVEVLSTAHMCMCACMCFKYLINLRTIVHRM